MFRRIGVIRLPHVAWCSFSTLGDNTLVGVELAVIVMVLFGGVEHSARHHRIRAILQRISLLNRSHNRLPFRWGYNRQPSDNRSPHRVLTVGSRGVVAHEKGGFTDVDALPLEQQPSGLVVEAITTVSIGVLGQCSHIAIGKVCHHYHVFARVTYYRATSR